MSDEGRDKEPEGKKPQGSGGRGAEGGRDRRRRRGSRGGHGRAPEEAQRPENPRQGRDGRSGRPNRPGDAGQNPPAGQKPQPKDQRQRNDERQRGGERPLPETQRVDRGTPEQAKTDRPRIDKGGGDQRDDGRPAEGQGSGRHAGRRRFGRGGRGGDGGRGTEGGQERRESPLAMPQAEAPLCPLCSKPVFDLASAIGADRETGLPAHFDCVYDRVKAAENLGPNERVVYLGAGSFAVVEFKDAKEGAFFVKRRIQWEKENEKKDWRRAINTRFSGG